MGISFGVNRSTRCGVFTFILRRQQGRRQCLLELFKSSRIVGGRLDLGLRVFRGHHLRAEIELNLMKIGVVWPGVRAQERAAGVRNGRARHSHLTHTVSVA